MQADQFANWVAAENLVLSRTAQQQLKADLYLSHSIEATAQAAARRSARQDVSDKLLPLFERATLCQMALSNAAPLAASSPTPMSTPATSSSLRVSTPAQPHTYACLSHVIAFDGLDDDEDDQLDIFYDGTVCSHPVMLGQSGEVGDDDDSWIFANSVKPTSVTQRVSRVINHRQATGDGVEIAAMCSEDLCIIDAVSTRFIVTFDKNSQHLYCWCQVLSCTVCLLPCSALLSQRTHL